MNPTGNYSNLTEKERVAIRKASSKEQFYLCAYCCQPISGESKDTINEHVEARNIAPNRSLDYSNIVASCKTKKQCDSAHGSQELPLTPLMDECETELKFKINGRVEGLTDRAIKTIQVLNLGDHETNNKSLVHQRKLAFHNVLLVNELDQNETEIVEDELLEILKSDLEQIKDGHLAPFATVVSKMIDSWLQ